MEEDDERRGDSAAVEMTWEEGLEVSPAEELMAEFLLAGLLLLGEMALEEEERPMAAGEAVEEEAPAPFLPAKEKELLWVGLTPPLPPAPAEEGPPEDPADGGPADEGPAEEDDEGCGEKLATLTATLRLCVGWLEDEAAPGLPSLLAAASDPDGIPSPTAAASDSGESSSADTSLDIDPEGAPPELEAAQKSAEFDPSSGRLETLPRGGIDPDTCDWEHDGPGCGPPSSTWSSGGATAPEADEEVLEDPGWGTIWSLPEGLPANPEPDSEASAELGESSSPRDAPDGASPSCPDCAGLGGPSGSSSGSCLFMSLLFLAPPHPAQAQPGEELSLSSHSPPRPGHVCLFGNTQEWNSPFGSRAGVGG